MKSGDLVIYKNTHRIPRPIICVILWKASGVSIDTNFYEVLLSDGGRKLISEHYLVEVVNESRD